MYDLLSQHALAEAVPERSTAALRHCLLTLDIGLELLRLRAIADDRATPAPVASILDYALRGSVRVASLPAAAAHLQKAEEAVLRQSNGAIAEEAAAALRMISGCVSAWDKAAA